MFLAVAQQAAVGTSQYRVCGYAELEAQAAQLGRFDTLVGNFALLEEPLAPTLNTLHGLLAEDGRLLIQTLHPWSVAAGEYQDGWRNESFAGFAGHWQPMPWYYRTLSSWLRALDMAGLRLVELQEPQHPQSPQPQSLLLVAERKSPA